jgi:hypothetical protein
MKACLFWLEFPLSRKYENGGQFVEDQYGGQRDDGEEKEDVQHHVLIPPQGLRGRSKIEKVFFHFKFCHNKKMYLKKAAPLFLIANSVHQMALARGVSC